MLGLSLVTLFLHISGSDGGAFWHISDLHLDFQYVTGGNSSNFCHGLGVDGTSPLNGSEVKKMGNYNCDAPELLVRSALKAMNISHPDPDFIVWTGDSAPHWRDPNPPSEDYVANVTKLVFTQLDKLFPNVPVIPALGNHDASPPDQFPIYNKTVNTTQPDYYRKLWRDGAFGDHINMSESNTFLECGYYTKTIQTEAISWRFIVLNTNIYYSDNLTIGEDPCGQMSWLNTTLQAASDEEKVFIVAHVPPGSFERDPGRLNFNTPEDYSSDINRKFVEIVTDSTNSAKITAHLYGHLHTDTFRLFLDADRSKAVGVAFMAASVTPILWVKKKSTGVNPTIRYVEFSDAGILTDYTEYSLDINNIEDTEDVAITNSRRKNAKFLREQSLVISEEESGTRRRREYPGDLDPSLELNTPETTTQKNTNTKEAPETTEGPPEENTNTKQPVVGSDDMIQTSSTETPNPYDFTVQVPAEDSNNDPTAAQFIIANWKPLYTATKAFNVPDLTANSMFEAYKRMAEDVKSAEFSEYYNHNTGGHNVGECNQTCWRGHLCTITYLLEDGLNQCLNGTADFYNNSTTSDEQQPISGDEVTDSTRNPTMSSMDTTISLAITTTTTTTSTTATSTTEAPMSTTFVSEAIPNENDHSHDVESDHYKPEVADVESDADVTKEKIQVSFGFPSNRYIFFHVTNLP